jgi:hypothetical protein
MTAVAAMVDCTHAAVGSIPASTPKIAGYVTGSDGVCWTEADWRKFSGSTVTIDQTPGGDTFAAGHADVFDVEAYAGTLAAAEADAHRRQATVTAVKARQAAGFYSTIYISAANLAALKTALAGDPDVRLNQVGFWVANWSLSASEAAAQLGNEIVAIQWASPTSNPHTLLPGSRLTLAEANADLSVTLASWYPEPAAPAKAAPAAKPKAKPVRKAVKATAKVTAKAVSKEPVMTVASANTAIAAAVVWLAAHAGLHWTSTQQAAIITIVTGLSAAAAAWLAKPRRMSVFTGALSTAAIATSAFGLHFSPAYIAAEMPAIAALVGVLLRSQVTPANGSTAGDG